MPGTYTKRENGGIRIDWNVGKAYGTESLTEGHLCDLLFDDDGMDTTPVNLNRIFQRLPFTQTSV